MRIYLDNAATTSLCQEAKSEMIRIMEEVYGNPSSIHSEGRKARTVIENGRKTIANAINASVGEIFFTSGSTEAANMVIEGAVNNLGVTRIISSPIEHHCVLHPLEKINKSGITVDYLKVGKKGQIDYDELTHLLSTNHEKTLVCLMHANNEIGTINDVGRISEICSLNKAYFFSDTTQTIGHIPIDVQQNKFHFLTGSAHKFYGPKGCGFVYINSEITIDPLILGGSQERNMRAGTENIIGIAGMAAAFNYILLNLPSFQEKISSLREYLKSGILANIDGSYINGDDGSCLPKILSVSFPPSSRNEMLLMNLDISGIAASGGSACSSGVESQSGVLDFIGEPQDRKTVRFSFSHNNTYQQLDKVIESLKILFPKI